MYAKPKPTSKSELIEIYRINQSQTPPFSPSHFYHTRKPNVRQSHYHYTHTDTCTHTHTHNTRAIACGVIGKWGHPATAPPISDARTAHNTVRSTVHHHPRHCSANSIGRAQLSSLSTEGERERERERRGATKEPSCSVAVEQRGLIAS